MVYYGTVKVDRQGRVTLPHEAREELKLYYGDRLQVSTEAKVIRLWKAVKP